MCTRRRSVQPPLLNDEPAGSGESQPGAERHPSSLTNSVTSPLWLDEEWRSWRQRAHRGTEDWLVVSECVILHGRTEGEPCGELAYTIKACADRMFPRSLQSERETVSPASPGVVHAGAVLWPLSSRCIPWETPLIANPFDY